MSLHTKHSLADAGSFRGILFEDIPPGFLRLCGYYIIMNFWCWEGGLRMVGCRSRSDAVCFIWGTVSRDCFVNC
jgi:hypothetical protein